MGTDFRKKIQATEICCICGQQAYSKTKGRCYCAKHFNSMYTFGQPFGKIQTTRKCNNSYVYYPEYNAYAVIENVKDPNTKVFLISEEDFEKIHNKSWYIDTQGYINTSVPRNDGTTRSIPIKLYNYIMEPQKGNVIDHMNRNKLDNRRENLRECTKLENDRNKIQEVNKSPIFRGVRLTENGKKYRTRIKVMDKEINLGTYETKEEAINARLEAEKRYYGEFAASNAPDNNIYNTINQKVHEEYIDKLDHSNDDNITRPFYFIREKDFKKYDNIRTDGGILYPENFS